MNSNLSTNFVTDTNGVLCNNSIIDADTPFQNNPTTSTDNTFNPTQMADTNFFDQTPTAGLNTTFAATPSIKSEDPFHTNTSTYQNNNFGEVPQDFVYYGMVNGGFSMHDGTDLNGLMNDDGFGIDMGAYAMNTEMNFNTSEMVQQATAELSNGYATSRQNEALERAATLQQMGRRR
ncbi:hypothetical protein BKA66DRAFT_478723 [Pyrenochaeta sp. MPI-SDFR-AT-0127]|nr:hypothetical protein BKA66DRAFT_478723 [Pyrenochaeta sp. MPI-SDFR-AT-0127]